MVMVENRKGVYREGHHYLSSQDLVSILGSSLLALQSVRRLNIALDKNLYEFEAPRIVSKFEAKVCALIDKVILYLQLNSGIAIVLSAIHLLDYRCPFQHLSK